MSYKKQKQYRLPHYDYAQPGEYFITICTKDRKHFFGKITNTKMHLSEIGIIAAKYLKEIHNIFPHIELDEWVVMPNHVHVILIIEEYSKNAPRRVPTDSLLTDNLLTDNLLTDNLLTGDDTISIAPSGLHPLVKGSISSVINHFKGNVRKWCNKNEHPYFAWQSRFHDHIIRNRDSLENIRQYIRDNALKWEEDKFS